MKKKIKLDNIKVTSFVTNMESDQSKETVKGGGRVFSNPTCESGVFCNTEDRELCNFTCNRFCASGRCGTVDVNCGVAF